jgi:drug/metabolite transporter (DMT)-like permease
MLYLVSSVLLSVALLLNFRLFPRFGINTAQAIALNYPVCFVTGWLFLPAGQSVSLDLSQTWTWLALGLGIGFIITFLLSGASTQRNGITATSLANNLSLVIPVLFNLLVFNTATKFDWLNYAGLGLAVVAVGLSAVKGDDKSVTKRAGNWLPIAVFLCYGFTNALINYMNIRYISSPDKTVVVTLTMVLGAVLGGVVLLVWRWFQQGERIEGRNLVAAVTLGIPNFLSFYTLLLALSEFGGNGAFVYPVYNIGVILVAAGVAGVFFREKLLTINKIGLALAVLAIGLLSWQALAALWY